MSGPGHARNVCNNILLDCPNVEITANFLRWKSYWELASYFVTSRPKYNNEIVEKIDIIWGEVVAVVIRVELVTEDTQHLGVQHKINNVRAHWQVGHTHTSSKTCEISSFGEIKQIPFEPLEILFDTDCIFCFRVRVKMSWRRDSWWSWLS